MVERVGFLPALTGHASFEGYCRSGAKNDLAHGSTLRSWSRGVSKNAFSFVFDPGLPRSCHARAFTQKYVTTHCINTILLDQTEILRDNFKKKLAEKPRMDSRTSSRLSVARISLYLA